MKLPPEQLDRPNKAGTMDKYEIINTIMSCGCITIINGKRFGELLGELLGKVTTAEDHITALEADVRFYRCCALSGEVPKNGSEPSALLKQEQE